MKKLINTTANLSRPFAQVILIFAMVTIVACEMPELPEEGSIADLTPPSAGFSAIETQDFLTYEFSNTSASAINFTWDFGDGGSSSEKNPTHTFPGEGTYNVTLNASDALNASNAITKAITVVEPPLPPAINPDIANGDFENSSYDDWKIETWSDGTTRNPYNGSSDGETMNYDGTTPDSKTRGAKWTQGTSACHLRSSSSRHAYQAVTVSPDREYTLEYSYAIKADKADVDGGDRVVVEILDGHFSDGVNAEASNRIITHVGNIALGKGNFTLVREPFTAPSTGLISIWMWACTSEDAYIDNVKIYPAE